MSFDVVNGKVVFVLENKGLSGLSILWETPVLEEHIENAPLYLVQEEISCLKTK